MRLKRKYLRYLQDKVEATLLVRDPHAGDGDYSYQDYILMLMEEESDDGSIVNGCRCGNCQGLPNTSLVSFLK